MSIRNVSSRYEADGDVDGAVEAQVCKCKRKAHNWCVLAVAAVLTAGAGSAEEEAESEAAVGIEEMIVVAGIRSSMQLSLDRKRNADHFVDAITAEDIGAFPDQNLAESLQRISGVAIDRKSGEGAFVSVRGLGPNFVQTTINGRVAASNVSPGSHDGRGATNEGSRTVGFHGFQSGVVQAVEVSTSLRGPIMWRAASAVSWTSRRASRWNWASGISPCRWTRRETNLPTTPRPACSRCSATCWPKGWASWCRRSGTTGSSGPTPCTTIRTSATPRRS